MARSIFYAIIFILPSVFSNDIRVNGPDVVIAGDYERFTCDMEGNNVSQNYGYEWKFKLKNGELIVMNDSDVLTALEVQRYTPKHLTVSSFLRADNPEIIGVACSHSSKTVAFKDIEVKDLTTISVDDDPCAKAENTGKPVTSVFMPSPNMLSPAYRRSHFINDQYLQLSYGVDVTEIKLVCYSPSNDKAPVWSFNKDIASKLRFAAWAQQPAGQCNRQILHIYQVAGEAGEVVNLKLDCKAGDLTSKINLGLEFPISRSGGMDMNATANCINEIVDSFYNKELTGVSIGGSFAIIMMMVGMAVLKKQLEQQKNINRDLQGKNQVGGTANGGSSTEHLNSNHNNLSNGNNYP